MAYSTPAMLRKALVPGSDGAVPNPISRTAADLTDTELADFIAEADAQIDSLIGRFYAVPVAPVLAGDVLGDGAGPGNIPHPIDYWSRNLAAYFATLSYRKGADFTDQDPIARRYTATMQALDAVSQGRARLQLPDNTSTAAGVGAGTAKNPYVGNLFGAEDFNLFPINPAWPFVPDTSIWIDRRW